MTQPPAFRSAGARQLVHPNAPSGGCGPGPSRAVGITNGAGGPGPHVGSPAARQTNWASTLNSREHPFVVVDTFDKRIAAARSLQQLLEIASDIAQVREDLVKRKAIRTPVPGDQAIKDLVLSLVTEKMSTLQKIAFTATQELVEAGASAATAKACAEALSEAIDFVLEEWLGKFAKALRGAIEKRDVPALVKACAAAIEDLAAGLKDGNSLVRRTLQILKARGVNLGEAQLGKWVLARLDSFTSVIKEITSLWTAHPLVIIARLLLTPSNTASDSEGLFLLYKELGDKLQARMREIAPLPPMRARDLLQQRVPAGPALRAAL